MAATQSGDDAFDAFDDFDDFEDDRQQSSVLSHGKSSLEVRAGFCAGDGEFIDNRRSHEFPMDEDRK